MTSFHSHLFAAGNEQDEINSFDLKFLQVKQRETSDYLDVAWKLFLIYLFECIHVKVTVLTDSPAHRLGVRRNALISE